MSNNDKGKNNKKHINNAVTWVLFIIAATATAFFLVMTISEKNSAVFSADPSGATAASQNVVTQDVSVMIIPAD